MFGGFCLVFIAILCQVAANGIRYANNLALNLQLKIAGVGLLLTGIAAALFGLAPIGFFLLTLADILPRRGLPSAGADVAVILGLCVAVLSAGVVVILGARALLNRSTLTFALIASVIGQPIGLWVLWVLRNREVRESFLANRETSGATANEDNTEIAPFR